MPKHALQIRYFNGMVGVADERDLAAGTAAYAKNLNMVTQAGAFEGLPNDESTGYAISGGTVGGKTFIPFEDGTKAVYHSGSAIIVVENLDGTPSTASVTDNYTPSEAIASGDETGVSDGEAVHFGLGGVSTQPPVWIGEPKFGQYGVTTPPIGLVKTRADLTNKMFNDLPTGGNTTVTWTTSESEVVYKRYALVKYLASATYDQYQEGPLKPIAEASILPTGSDVGAKSVSVSVYINTGDGEAGKRISHVNVYRQVIQWVPASEYTWVGLESDIEHVKTIEIDDAAWTSTTWSTESGYFYTITDDGYVGQGYEERVGINPTVTDWSVHYGLSVAADGYHVVGDIWHSGLGTKPNMLMRSKWRRYDTFDWTQDYLVLPTAPTALAHFAGRTYAFSPGRTYIINPEAMTLEETLEGVGALHSKCVLVCDRGMFWCDESNIYWHNGAQLKPIGNPIMTNKVRPLAGYADSTISSSNLPTIFYSAKYDSVVIYYNYSGTTYGWMFHVATERWVHLTAGADGITQGAFTGPDGIPMVGINGTLYTFATSSALRSWQWYSRDLVQEPGTERIFYEAIMSWDDAVPTLQFYDDDPNYAVGHNWTNTSADRGRVQRGQINVKASGQWDRVRNFALRIDNTAPTVNTVNDITLIYRDLTPR